MAAPRRAVVDTNILVSVLLKSGSLPAAIAQQIRDGSLTPVVCDEIVGEYRSVLRRSKLTFNGRDASELIDLFASRADWVRLSPFAAMLDLPDPDD